LTKDAHSLCVIHISYCHSHPNVTTKDSCNWQTCQVTTK